MINTNRIVPIQKIDLISLYGLILLQNSNNSALVKIESETIEGDFFIETNNAVLIDATASSVSAATIYFVPAFNYVGFTVDGAPATVAANGVNVKPDGHTLYKAVFGSGTVTITQVGF